jgi:hypothetical protein
MPRILPHFLALCLAGAAHATTINESSRHDLAAGSWGVAWINGSDVMISNGLNSVATLLPGVNATKLIGADVTGDGQQELIYISGGGLYYYNFATQSSSGPFGSSINEVTAGVFLNAPSRDTVMVSNGAGSTGALYAFDGATNSFTSLGGSNIRSMSRGNFNAANAVDEFAVVNTGNQPYIYTPNGTGGGAYTAAGGADYRAVVGGNLTAVGVDEFWLLYSAGYTVYYTENPAGTQNNVNTSGVGTAQLAVGTGDLDGNGMDEGYVLGAGASNVLYRYRAGIGYDVYPPGGGNTGWSSFIAADFDNDGSEELFAIKMANPGVLYRFDPAREGEFTAITAPSGSGPDAAPLGNAATNTSPLDGWRAIMIVNESDTYTNSSGVPEQVTIQNFNVYIGAARGRVTPFVVRVLGDNNFNVLAIGTTRVFGADYTAIGTKVFPFGPAPVVFTLNPGEKLAGGYTDSNPDGTGNDASVVPYTDGGDQIWLTGGPNSSNAGSITVGAMPAPGPGGTTYTTLTRAYATNVSIGIVPLGNVPPRDILLAGGVILTSATAGTSVGTLSTDDRNTADTHTYALATNPGGTFSLAGNMLSLATAPGPVGTAYVVRIRSTDNGGMFLEKDFTFTVTAPQPPSALTTSAEVLLQTTAVGSTVGRLFTTDPNAGDTHTYSLVTGAGSADNAFFTLVGDEIRLAQAIPAGKTSLAFRARTTDGAGLFLEAAFTVSVIAPEVRINEFVANNDTGLNDEDGAQSDWIELFNPTAVAVNLAGWKLTDLPGGPGWSFPSVNLPAGGYLVVFASGKNRTVQPGNLHTDFSLDSAGEYLALIKPGGAVADVYQPHDQANDIAYGWGSGGGRGYLVPTPNAANGPAFGYGISKVTFSIPRGFYTTAQSLALTSDTPGAVLRYTTDGSKPTAGNGLTYTGPIVISPETSGATRGTKRIRAVALSANAAANRTASHTYLFVNGIAAPATDGIVSQTNSNNAPQTSAIRTNPTYAALLDDALLDLPALCINNPGLPTPTESEASVELVHPTGAEPGFHIVCGIQAVGNASLSSPKNNFRLYFRSQYGESKLKYDLFPNHPYDAHGAATSFDRLNIRSCSHDTFHWLAEPSLPPSPGTPADALYLRNILMDDLQFAMGKMSTHGRYVNCFVNGQYHGLYHIREYPNDDFFASYLPGGQSAYEFTNGANVGENGSGNWPAVWSAIRTYATTGGAANYAEFQRRCNATDLADFVVLNWWAGNNWDWNPNQNWMAGGPNQLDMGGWRFFSYDNDIIWMSENANVVGRNVPDSFFNTLMATHPDFQILVRDRAYRHLFHNGALTNLKARAALELRENQIQKAIVAETARWQPNNATSLPWDRDGEWRTELNRMKNTFFPVRCAVVVSQIKAQGWYPVDAPEFMQDGGSVAPGTNVTITGPAGTAIYFTTDGSDPRLPGGTISPLAFNYASPPAGTLTINAVKKIRARAKSATDWSALHEATFTPGTLDVASSANICLTEIHYHPLAGSEFIELMNVGPNAVDLGGCAFASGIEYTFPAGTVLAAGARLVVSQPQFLNGSRLSDGERLRLVAPDLTTSIRDFTFDHQAPWPTTPDGGGPSLVLRQPSAANATDGYHANGFNWRPSSSNGGNPGTSDSSVFAGIVTADADADGLNAFLEYALGTSEAAPNLHSSLVTLARDAQNPGSFLFTYQRALIADDITDTVQTSTDTVLTWSNVPTNPINVVTNGPTQTVTYRLTPPPGTAQFLVRVRVQK